MIVYLPLVGLIGPLALALIAVAVGRFLQNRRIRKGESFHERSLTRPTSGRITGQTL